MRHYQTDVASAWHCARLVTDEDFGKKQGVILFTGGGLATHPLASFTPLSIDKTALRALASNRWQTSVVWSGAAMCIAADSRMPVAMMRRSWHG